MTHVSILALTKRYAQRAAPVLQNFSLEVAQGEMVALLGPSGSGKSTLLKLISGIERPDAGEVRFDGASILALPPSQRGAVFMFQKSYLFPFLNVAENIAFGLTVKGTPQAEKHRAVSEMLDLIGLPGIEKRKPSQLSGGEQQRVALARALVVRPKLLLLDEPLSSLDTEVRLNLQEAIRTIQRALNITTLLVTHDLGEAMALSDRMALLLHGRVAALDQPQQLFHRPPCVASARFVGVTLFLTGLTAQGWLESGLGRLRIQDATRVGPAVFAIRPEHIRLSTTPGENALPGVVHSCLYRGEYMEYQLALGGLAVRARQPLSAGHFAPGERVLVHLPVEHLFEVAG